MKQQLKTSLTINNFLVKWPINNIQIQQLEQEKTHLGYKMDSVLASHKTCFYAVLFELAF